MTQKHTFENEFPGNWRLLGEMELPLSTPINNPVYAWLVETLRPLDLNHRFLNKIIASTQHALLHDFKTATEAGHSHVHLLIYTPEDNPSNGQSWGFFRVEKKGDWQSGRANMDHAVVFYLYQEGM